MKLTYRIDSGNMGSGHKQFFRDVKALLETGFTETPTHFQLKSEDTLEQIRERGQDIYIFCLNNNWVKEHNDILRSYSSQGSREYRAFVGENDIAQYKKRKDGEFERLFPLPDQIISLDTIPGDAIDTIIMNCTMRENADVQEERQRIYKFATEKGVEVIGYQAPREIKHIPAAPPPMPVGLY
jgi:hypothetical protein